LEGNFVEGAEVPLDVGRKVGEEVVGLVDWVTAVGFGETGPSVVGFRVGMPDTPPEERQNSGE